MKIESSKVAQKGIAVIVSVTEVGDKVYYDFHLEIPEKNNQVNLAQFEAAISGLALAQKKITELLDDLNDQ